MTDQVCRVLEGPYKVLIVLTSKNPVAVVLQLLTMILHQTLDSLHTNLVELNHHLSGGMGVVRQEAKRANLVQNVEAVGVLGAHGAGLNQDFTTDGHEVSSPVGKLDSPHDTAPALSRSRGCVVSGGARQRFHGFALELDKLWTTFFTSVHQLLGLVVQLLDRVSILELCVAGHLLLSHVHALELVLGHGVARVATSLSLQSLELSVVNLQGGFGHHRGEGGGPSAEGLGRLAHLVDDLEGFGEGVAGFDAVETRPQPRLTALLVGQHLFCTEEVGPDLAS